ncbi:HAMP domain-containing sensor histidine kinase [Thermus sp.]|uniref:sensor histidine kinase n=1 Tax=Thermus sp. TaxID=275 RepID=UPI00307D4CD0
MGFRFRLTLAFLGVGILLSLTQVWVGLVFVNRALESDLALDLEKLRRVVLEALDLRTDPPTLDPDRLVFSPELALGTFRLSRDGVVLLEGGRPFPANGVGWWVLATPLEGGYRLEVAMDLWAHSKALRDYLRAGLATLFVGLLLALLAGALLPSPLLRSLVRLTQAIEELAQARFPDPLPLPPGRDELHRLGVAFNRMVEGVRRALERERLFTRYASHQLRTPLAAFCAQLESLEAGLVSWEEARLELKLHLQRMEAVLEGLLHLARAEGVQPRPLEAGQVVRQAAQVHPGVALEVPEGPVWVMGHTELLLQALENLLENAFHHGRPPVHLQVRLGQGEAAFCVRDHGPGLPPPLLARLGEPFLSGSPRGLGLGLAFVVRLAEVLRGRLEVRNLEPGLEVALWLPLVKG